MYAILTVTLLRRNDQVHPIVTDAVMMSIVRRHISGRHLTEAQNVLDQWRQTFRLPNEVVGHRCVGLG